MTNVLYLHGMGGGGDSRIPSILDGFFSSKGVRITVRTYDFDPEIAHEQISSWINELNPVLIVGESLGAIHAIRIKGIPHLLISPALNAPFYLGRIFSILSLIPGMTCLLGRIYTPREGDRQQLHFSYNVLRKYVVHGKEAMMNSSAAGSQDFFHAFIGTKDHYRKYGVVSLRSWKKYFGESYTIYEGSHYTEEEHINSQVIPLICKLLEIK